MEITLNNIKKNILKIINDINVVEVDITSDGQVSRILIDNTPKNKTTVDILCNVLGVVSHQYLGCCIVEEMFMDISPLAFTISDSYNLQKGFHNKGE